MREKLVRMRAFSHPSVSGHDRALVEFVPQTPALEWILADEEIAHSQREDVSRRRGQEGRDNVGSGIDFTDAGDSLVRRDLHKNGVLC